MSGGLDIRGGGAVEVDTATLRDAALGFARLAQELEDICTLVGSVGSRLSGLSRVDGEATWRVEMFRRRIRDAIDGANQADADLRAAAAVYEIADLNAQRAAAEAAGDAVAASAIDRRIAVVVDEYPDARSAANIDATGWALAWPLDLAGQAGGAWWWASPVAVLGVFATTLGVLQTVRMAGAGTIPAGSTLKVTPSAFIVAPLRTTTRASAPPTLAAAAARIPGGDATRIRVERYSMPDGSRQFAVYVAGTQSLGATGRDPFDMVSNAQLYSGSSSASYSATRAALAQSGAKPGDVVHAFGHSQGAMIAAHLAMEGDYDVRTLASFGSPVEADVGRDTLSVALRHTDDPVAALAGGGHAAAVGAPGSFIAERLADPAVGGHDVGLPGHGIAAYIETAEMLDASTDPRMGQVRALFAELGTATSVESVAYSAERVTEFAREPRAQPRPEPGPSPVPSVSPPAADAGKARGSS